MSGPHTISNLLHLQGLLMVQEGCRGCFSHLHFRLEGLGDTWGLISVSKPQYTEADWPELSRMTIPAAREAGIHHFYSGWQWTPLKIRALLLKRKENGCGSRQLALCHNESPLSVSPALCAPCWWVKASLLKVGGLWTSSPSVTWECVRNADSQSTPDLLS